MGSPTPDPINRTRTPFLSVPGAPFPVFQLKTALSERPGTSLLLGTISSLATFTGFAPFSVAVAKPGSYH